MTLKGGPELVARLNAAGDTRQLLGRVGLLGVRYGKELVPRRIGNLGRTIRLGEVTDRHAQVKAGGQHGVGYATAVERGSRPHVIVPRRRRVLAWGGSRTLSGRVRAGSALTHFATRVNHPGTRAQPFLVPGVMRAAREHGTDIIVALWNEAA